ncbi:hypothetical protein [Laspinema palackyanum]
MLRADSNLGDRDFADLVNEAIATQTGFFCFNRTVEATGGEKAY